jgi:hypothetical protein
VIIDLLSDTAEAALLRCSRVRVTLMLITPLEVELAEHRETWWVEKVSALDVVAWVRTEPDLFAVQWVLIPERVDASDHI